MDESVFRGQVGDGDNDLCCVPGCQLPGSLASATTGTSEWYCRAHFGADYSAQAGITAKASNRISLFRLAMRCANAPAGAPVNRQIEALLQQLDRADILTAAREAAGTRTVTGRALTRQILGAFDRECRVSTDTTHTAPQASEGSEWLQTAGAQTMEAPTC